MNTPENPEISSWLKELDHALQSLPKSDRDEIVSEAKSHIEERLSQGLNADQSLFGFGRAKTYAQGFIDQFQINHAVTTGKIFTMIKTLWNIAKRSLMAVFGLLGAFIFAGLALGSVIGILLKIINPSSIELSMSAGKLVVLSSVNGAVNLQNSTGNALYLVLIVSVIFSAFMTRMCLINTLKSIKDTPKQA